MFTFFFSFLSYCITWWFFIFNFFIIIKVINWSRIDIFIFNFKSTWNWELYFFLIFICFIFCIVWIKCLIYYFIMIKFYILFIWTFYLFPKWKIWILFFKFIKLWKVDWSWTFFAKKFCFCLLFGTKNFILLISSCFSKRVFWFSFFSRFIHFSKSWPNLRIFNNNHIIIGKSRNLIFFLRFLINLHYN